MPKQAIYESVVQKLVQPVSLRDHIFFLIIETEQLLVIYGYIITLTEVNLWENVPISFCQNLTVLHMYTCKTAGFINKFCCGVLMTPSIFSC